MPIHYPDILDEGTQPIRVSYDDRDLILYALSVGMGQDPMNRTELPFVYEKALKVVPTAVTVLAMHRGRGDPLPAKPGHRPSSFNPLLSVHGEQKVEFFKPLAKSGTFTVRSRNIGIFDKGEGKGSVLRSEMLCEDEDGSLIAKLTSSGFLRGDGGFGGPSDGQPEPHSVPERAPDLSLDFPTSPSQALLYRLNGDRNPIHADPDIAARARFERPLLHGLCTYGITCRAVLQAYTDYEPDRIASHEARFSSPVFPGDIVTVDLWQDGPIVSFMARVSARDAIVIRNGKTVLR